MDDNSHLPVVLTPSQNVVQAEAIRRFLLRVIGDAYDFAADSDGAIKFSHEQLKELFSAAGLEVEYREACGDGY